MTQAVVQNLEPQSLAFVRDGLTEKGRAWLVVAVATLGMAAAYGAISTTAVLIAPFEAEFGWARAEISAAYAVMTLGIAAGGLGAGRLVDRFPAGPFAGIGAAMIGLCMMALARQNSMPAMQAIYLLMGMFGFAGLYAPLLATVSLWFRQGYGIALGIVTAGGAIGQAVVPPVFQLTVLHLGWREACFWFGLAYLVLLTPVMLLIVKAAPVPAMANATAQAGGGGTGVLPSIILVGFAGLTCCALMGVPNVHLIAHAASVGIAPASATGLVTIAMLAGAIGRLATGWLVDRIGGLRAYALVSLIQTASVYGFVLAGEFRSMVLVAAIYGLGFGGVMTGLVCTVREAVPARMLGTSMAMVGLFAWAGMALGGYQGGLCFDLTGDYDASFRFATAAGIVNLGVLGAIGLLRRRQGAAGNPARVS